MQLKFQAGSVRALVSHAYSTVLYKGYTSRSCDEMRNETLPLYHQIQEGDASAELPHGEISSQDQLLPFCGLGVATLENANSVVQIFTVLYSITLNGTKISVEIQIFFTIPMLLVAEMLLYIVTGCLPMAFEFPGIQNVPR